MALEDPYISVEDFLVRIGKDDEKQMESIASIVVAASRQVDGWVGRCFNKSASAEARVFTVDEDGWWSRRTWRAFIETDDLVSVSELALDNGSGLYTSVVPADGFALKPTRENLYGRPYTHMEFISPYSPPYGVRDGIRITGIFGWPSVPAPIVEATFELANRMNSMRTAPFGISGSGELGTFSMASTITPIIAAQISQYRILAL